MTRTHSLTLASLLLLATLPACGGGEPAPPAPAPAGALPPGHPPIDGSAAEQGQAPTPAVGPLRVGVVQEVIEAPGYVYARLDTGGEEVWIAAPATPLTVGSRVETPRGNAMPGFHSPSLDRTFEELWFVSAVRPEGTTPAASIAPSTPGAPHGGVDGGAAPVAPVAPLAGGSTVAEALSLAEGASAAVRGRVVKVNRGILGLDWIHLQDGSGSAADGTNDLLVTVAPGGPAPLGEVVVARGKVARDKDFGSGYRYAMILQEATLTADGAASDPDAQP